jgi:hypothetical protein
MDLVVATFVVARSRDRSAPLAEALLGLGELGGRPFGFATFLLGLVDQDSPRPLGLLRCDLGVARFTRESARFCAQCRHTLARRAPHLVATASRRLHSLERPETDCLQLFGQPATFEQHPSLVVDGRGTKCLAEPIEERGRGARAEPLASGGEQSSNRLALRGRRLADIVRIGVSLQSPLLDLAQALAGAEELADELPVGANEAVRRPRNRARLLQRPNLGGDVRLMRLLQPC